MIRVAILLAALVFLSIGSAFAGTPSTVDCSCRTAQSQSTGLSAMETSR